MNSSRILLRVLLLLATTLLLPGCYQLEQVVNVRPDGSGTYVVTVKTNKAGRAEIGAEGEHKDRVMTDEGLLDDLFHASAPNPEEGCELESRVALKDGEILGIVATYRFTDITKLKPDTSFSFGNAANTHDFARFEFRKGDPSTLIVHLPWQKRDPAPQEAPDLAAEPRVASSEKDTGARKKWRYVAS